MSIKDVVLDHKDYVKNDRHDTQHPLHNVETSAREGAFTMPDCLNNILKDGEGATCEVKHDICD
jgi:hypothetical protein